MEEYGSISNRVSPNYLGFVVIMYVITNVDVII